MTTKSEVLHLVGQHGALKDSELAQLLGVAHQQVNQATRSLAAAGLIARDPGSDGVIRNRRLTSQEPTPYLQSASSQDTARPHARPRPILRGMVAGTPVTREDLIQLGFEEHLLERLPSADVPDAGFIGWNTLGHLPDAPGLYSFIGQCHPTDGLRVFYVGMTSHLWMVTRGQLPGGIARGGQRYGRPKHAGVTRQRVNAEVARMAADGWIFTHWVRAVEAPADAATLEALLRAEEARLIRIWDLRVVGWNRA